MELNILSPENLNSTVKMHSLKKCEEELTKQEIVNTADLCGICGDPHSYKHCKYVTITSKIADKKIPTRARLSLPDNLEIKTLTDQTCSVFAIKAIQAGVEFGPFVAQRNLTLHPATPFPLKIFMNKESDLSEYYLDTVDENECSWMMFVKPASEVEQQNLICYQEGEDIFFTSTRDIPPGEELQVWYSPYYAYKMQKNTLAFKSLEKLQTELEIKPDLLELNNLIKDQQKIIPRIVWNCKFCYKLEKNVTDFAKHLLTHYIRHKKITCEICQIRFRFIADYRRHMRFAHGDVPGVNVDKGTDKNKIHVKILESSKKFNGPQKHCSIGGPLLTEGIADSLENSNGFMPQPTENLFEIDSYDNPNMLFESENLRFNLEIGNTMRDFDDLAGEARSGEPEQKDFVCDICLKRFSSVKSLASHLRFHVGQYYCSSCKKVFCRAENLKHHKCNHVYSIKCPKCPKMFPQKKYLSKHISIFHEKKFACNLCRKICYSSVELQNHVCKKASKEGKQLLSCKSCPKQFRSYRGFKLHVKNNHSKASHIVNIKYICAECSEMFASRDTYKRHVEALHEKSRKYQCQICDKRFNRKDILKKHMLCIHKIGALQNFPCPTCQKVFKSQSYLNVHLKGHYQTKTHLCESCNTTFKFRRNLVRHKKIVHSKQVPPRAGDYECPVCKIKVKLKNSLQRHIRKKHPETYKNQCAQVNAKREETKHQLYRCPICHQTRKFMGSLKKHIEVKHPEEYKNACSQLGETEYLVEKEKKKPITFDEEFDNFMDLQKTIENMDFNTDTCNEILFSGSETIDRFLKERSDQISIFCADSPKQPAATAETASTTSAVEKGHNREVGLSMPDLSDLEQDVKIGKSWNTSGMLEPQMTINALDDVVLFVLNDKGT